MEYKREYELPYSTGKDESSQEKIIDFAYSFTLNSMLILTKGGLIW